MFALVEAAAAAAVVVPAAVAVWSMRYRRAASPATLYQRGTPASQSEQQ